MSSREVHNEPVVSRKEYGGRGVGVSSSLFFLKHGKSPIPTQHIVIITPKSLFKKAVERNRARRRVRAAVASLLGTLPLSFVRITISLRDRVVLTLPFKELKNQLQTLLERTPLSRLRGARTPENAS